MKKVLSIVSLVLLMAILGVTFIACDAAVSYQKKLEDAGYEVAVSEEKDGDITKSLVANDGLKTITITWGEGDGFDAAKLAAETAALVPDVDFYEKDGMFAFGTESAMKLLGFTD